MTLGLGDPGGTYSESRGRSGAVGGWGVKATGRIAVRFPLIYS